MSNQFLTNYTKTSFLTKIQENLHTCSTFDFSVSFIKKAGLVLLYKDIEAALARGAKGRLITSTYQNFTDIDSLKRFLVLTKQYTNFACHLDYESFVDGAYAVLGYHSKGYLFTFPDHTEVVVGSSNITRYALLKNIEWDVAVNEADNPEVFQAAQAEFEDKWNNTPALDLNLIKKYTIQLDYAIERWDMDYDLSQAQIKPNFMQRKALKELNRYRAMGVGKALIVAAAGSGKTYLAAFDALNFNPHRLLYIVHEESILRKALETFQNVFGPDHYYGIYSGTQKDLDAEFLFATNISMGSNLELFAKDEFDYIIIDECHHATAATYQKIISYFTPEFLLGLTATPERMDNADVFELFDENIPYELRLRDAIINDLVVPFHYYGIRDKLVDYDLSAKDEQRTIAQLGTEKNCSFIAEEIEKHRPEGKLKALAFCRNTTHARLMAEGMSSFYKTAYLTGSNDIGQRIRAYSDLQSDTTDLEILFTVDILNEGVDIPGVNMVLFLRPTESSTIFIQQLGRGLRKYENKQYVTVLDFIGNSYKRSVQIAFALSSLSDNFVVEKKLMTSLVEDDFAPLDLAKYGVQINIDALSKEEITKYIEQENFNSIRYLKQDYQNFKKYINTETYPKHMDYLTNDVAPDLIRFLSIKIKGKKTGSYYNFLRGIEETGLPLFTEEQIKYINVLSGYLPLARLHEYVIMDCLLHDIHSISAIDRALKEKVPGYQPEEFQHALTYMTKDYAKQDAIRLLDQEGDSLFMHVAMDAQFKEYLVDLIQYGISRYENEFGETIGFKLWQNYRKDQVMLKLCQNPNDIMLGTKYFDHVIYIFAALKKDASIEERLNYKDKFLQPDVFQWESRTDLPEADYHNLTTFDHACIFIRKMETEDGMLLPFTYVGTGKMTNPRPTNTNGTYLFDIIMDNELPDYLQYDFGLPKQSSSSQN